MKKLLPYFLFFISHSTFSQTPAIVWQKCFGGSSVETNGQIQHTQDGGYIFMCTSSSSEGIIQGHHGISEDIWVVKIDSMANIQRYKV